MTTIDRIQMLLTKRGCSAAQMMREIGLTSGTFSQWKKGLQEPNEKNLFKVAAYLDTTPEYLRYGITETGEPEEYTESPQPKSRRDEIISKLCDLSTDDLETLLEYSEFQRWKQNQKNQ